MHAIFKSLFLVLTAALLCACGLPPQEDRTYSQALTMKDSQDTRLGQALAPQIDQHPGVSGVVSLADSLDAFAARMLLIATAQRTVDVQYYIWRDDITGNLL